jgi:hypothetical protein
VTGRSTRGDSVEPVAATALAASRARRQVRLGPSPLTTRGGRPLLDQAVWTRRRGARSMSPIVTAKDRWPGGGLGEAEIDASALADAVRDLVHSNARTVSGAIRPNASVASRRCHAWQHETQRRCAALPLERRRGPRSSPAATGARGFARRLGTSSAPAQRGGQQGRERLA